MKDVKHLNVVQIKYRKKPCEREYQLWFVFQQGFGMSCCVDCNDKYIWAKMFLFYNE